MTYTEDGVNIFNTKPVTDIESVIQPRVNEIIDQWQVYTWDNLIDALKNVVVTKRFKEEFNETFLKDGDKITSFLQVLTYEHQEKLATIQAVNEYTSLFAGQFDDRL